MTYMKSIPIRLRIPGSFVLITAVILLAPGGILVGQGGQARTIVSPTPGEIAAGKVVYEQSCAYCHGLNGDGNGPVSAFLDVRPRDLASGIYKFRSTASGKIPTDWDLMQSVTRGIHGTSMVGWSSLAETKRWQLVHYIKTFSDVFDGEGDIETIPIGTPPPATQESIQRGKEVFMDFGCWACHGYGGKGDGPSAKFLQDSFGDPSVPRDLTEGDNYGRGHSPSEIYQTLVTGVDGTPMPSYLEAFEGSQEDLWHLARYVSFLSGEDR
ncbi:MAG: c-type cytochrome [Candidatus Neomarinimicrobiota bacterium]